MTYPPHALLRFGGRWFSTEEWSCGLRLITDQNDTTLAGWVARAEVILANMKPHVTNWFLDVDSGISNQARLDFVSLNAIGPDGHYADPGNPHILENTAAGAPTGTAPNATWPQLTTCISLRTAVTRGRATHGRVYTPTAWGAAANGRLSAGMTLGMANEFRDLIQDISTEDSLGLAGNIRVGVVSGLGDPGPARIVTKVMVGDVMDTQRRRRGNLPEVYSEVAVNQTG